MTTTTLDAQPAEIFRVAGPSIWPFVTAVGLIIIFAAEIFSLRALVIGGALLMLGGLAGWHWPERMGATESELAFEREHNIPVYPNGSPTVDRWAMALFVLLIFIALACFLFSYFYIRLVNPIWPPANIPLPDLLLPGISTALILAGAAAQRWALIRVRAESQGGLRLGLAVAFVAGAAALALLLYHFSQLTFDHSIHAYGSIYYTIGSFLLVIGLGGLLQNGFSQIWAWQGRYVAREHVAVDVGSIYWNAVAGSWLVGAGTMFVAPYLV